MESFGKQIQMWSFIFYIFYTSLNEISMRIHLLNQHHHHPSAWWWCFCIAGKVTVVWNLNYSSSYSFIHSNRFPQFSIVTLSALDFTLSFFPRFPFDSFRDFTLSLFPRFPFHSFNPQLSWSFKLFVILFCFIRLTKQNFE